MKRSRISGISIAEGPGCQHEETWCGERVDPDVAKKGASETVSTSEPPGSVAAYLNYRGPWGST